jgi:hypothetical protein
MATGWCPFAERITGITGFWIGNEGRKAVVMHVVAGSYRSCIQTFQGGKKSAHFVIAKDGRIAQFVSINDSAWANGLSYIGNRWMSPEQHWVSPSWADLAPPTNPNLVTISVEHEGQSSDPWTDAMFDANTRLLQWIGGETGLVYVPTRTLIGHNELSPVDRPNCPGPHCDFTRTAVAANSRPFQTRVATPVYEVPAVDPSRIALGGTATLDPGTEVTIDMTYKNLMAHLSSSLGFVEISKVRPA